MTYLTAIYFPSQGFLVGQLDRGSKGTVKLANALSRKWDSDLDTWTAPAEVA